MISKISEPFDTLIELLSVVIFDAELKYEILDTLLQFDELILLELRCMVYSITADDLFCKIEMDDLIF